MSMHHLEALTPVNPGVVDCVLYRRSTGERVCSAPLHQVQPLLADDADLFVWLGLYQPDEVLLRQVQQVFGLHELAVEDATRLHQRAKIESYGDMLFVVLRTADLVGNDIHYGTTAIFVGERHLISVRQGASMSYAPVRRRCESQPERMKAGPGHVLYAIMDYVVDSLWPITEDLTAHLHDQESSIFQEKFSRSMLCHMYELRAELVHFRMAVTPMQEICNYLLSHGKHETRRFVDPAILPYFRDIHDHLLRSLDAVAGLNEMLQINMDTYLALVSIDQNDIVKKLASWAALLAVPTMISSFYGMNFEHIPELKWHYGYYLALAFMALMSWLVYRRLRRTNWL